jgi:hypothetical protein
MIEQAFLIVFPARKVGARDRAANPGFRTHRNLTCRGAGFGHCSKLSTRFTGGSDGHFVAAEAASFING